MSFSGPFDLNIFWSSDRSCWGYGEKLFTPDATVRIDRVWSFSELDNYVHRLLESENQQILPLQYVLVCTNEYGRRGQAPIRDDESMSWIYRGAHLRPALYVERWETRHNTLTGLQTDMTLEPQAAPEYLVWYQNRTVTLVPNPSDYRQPQGFQGSVDSLHIMANLVPNMRHITLDGLQRNPADSWNHNAFLQLHDLTQQAMTVSKTSVWADSENPSQEFVPADLTQEYIPPRPPRTDRDGFQLGSGRMRKLVATQDTGGQSSTPHVSPYRPASPHHHPSPPFEQMHFDSDFINLDPNAGGFFETSYEGGHHSQYLGGDDIHNDQEDDQDHEDIRDQEHDDDADDAEHSSHDHDKGADQGQGPSDGTMPFTPIALGKGQRNIKKKKKCCMTDSREKKRKM
ncbi:OLC1v1007385C1 [Oldenlandia corymbosa var. corymbosa]|uniref:OLC1v1007385C1 n=1 Tax=Oldenlandia corymbosa var. corymbosa TaxID=529605 RepID=A0AAV1DJI1_OLDCO|nr:OLC1v1007385C1 [Oldenlandia corymbosa var. corymbosa]